MPPADCEVSSLLHSTTRPSESALANSVSWPELCRSQRLTPADACHDVPQWPWAWWLVATATTGTWLRSTRFTYVHIFSPLQRLSRCLVMLQVTHLVIRTLCKGVDVDLLKVPSGFMSATSADTQLEVRMAAKLCKWAPPCPQMQK